MSGIDTMGEGKKAQKSSRGGGLFRRKNTAKNKESSSSVSSSSSPQQQQLQSSPLRQRGRGGGGGGQTTNNGNNNNNAAAVTAAARQSITGLSYDNYYNSYADGIIASNNNNATEDFDDGSSFHSARQLKNLDDNNDNIKRSNNKATASWLCRTKYFRNICNTAFHVIDLDESGTIDEKELYSGLLLIHLKLGMYAGPAACKPLDRQRVQTIFHEMDTDKSGTLDQDEFCHVMMILFSNVVFRVMIQWSMTLMIVPLIAKALLDCIYTIFYFLYRVVVNLDEYSHVANYIELTIEAMGEAILHQMPSFLLKLAATASQYIQAIPDAVWNSIPLTLLSTILGMLVVPYLILKVDDFFQYLAASSQQQQQQHRHSSNSTEKTTTTPTAATSSTTRPGTEVHI